MLLSSDWMMISKGTENSKVPSHEIGRCARVQLSIWQRGKQSKQQMSTSESSVHFLELIEAEIKLTDQKRSREHFGVVGAFPAAILKMRGESKDVVLRWKGSKFKTRAAKATVSLAKRAFIALVSNYTF